MMHELYINDVNAGIYGIYLEKAPAIPIAKERGTWQNMPGLDGGYWVSEYAREAAEITLTIYVDAGRDIDAVIGYLMGAERVRVTPWLWEWEVNTQECAPSFSEWLEIPGEGFECEITYRAQPYRVVWPHAGADVTLSAGQTVTVNNPYTGSALPVISMNSGCKLTIGGVTLTATANATVDCEQRRITPAAAVTVSGSVSSIPRWPVLASGDNTVRATGAGASFEARWRLK